jgi:unsaturated rhamnogalacturonyl hydrolase
MKKFSILCIVLFANSCFAFAQTESMAAKVAATAMAKLWKEPIGADTAKPTKWTYDQGVVLLGIERLWIQTANPVYFSYMQKSMDYFVSENGDIKFYKAEDYNIDNILCGRILLTLYNVTGQVKYYKAASLLRGQLKGQPRTKEGGFWHKKVYPYQMWLDGLYMGQPFYTAYAKQFNEPEAFDDIANQFIWMEAHARDAKTGLLYHGWDESKEQKWANHVTGCSPHFWGRAMGWYEMALVDVLENFPATHPKRADLIAILKRLVDAIKKVQDPATGLWYDILNLPNEKGNYLEASASAMFVCATAKAVRLGFLPASYLAVSKKGYDGILKRFIKTDEKGYTNLEGTVSVSGLGGKPYRDGSFAYYMSEKVIVNDPKGVGAFIQAANEMEWHATSKTGKGQLFLLDDYYNAEKKKDIKGIEYAYHYKWPEMYNNGFSFLGNVITSNGLRTGTLSEAPTTNNLKNAAIYMIVDADNVADNPTPNFMNDKDAQEIYNWVKAGGVLVLFHNDKPNADFTAINKLSDLFGIHFNEDSHNKVVGTDYVGGKIDVPARHQILKNVQTIYQKEVCSITVKAPAKSMLAKGDLVVFATAKIGKGTVFATGDPWLYNEYTDGRKLPVMYQNAQAANDLVKWLTSQIPVKK